MIPYINTTNPSIPNVGIGGVRFVGVRKVQMANLRNVGIPETQLWVNTTVDAVPLDVPVTVMIGKPLADMPGCVKVHKENTGRDPSKNKMLVNDDPEGNLVLCDGGMPYFEPPNYEANQLTWTTVTPEQPDPEGGGGGDGSPPPPPPPGSDSPDASPNKIEDPDCPNNTSPKIGSASPDQKQKVVDYELQPNDQNPNGPKICVALYEDVPFIQQYTPPVQVITTTATIAVVATSSALLAKPLADLLLKVIKPLVKKISAKVKKVLGKSEKVLSVEERRLGQRDRNRAILALRRSLKK